MKFPFRLMQALILSTTLSAGAFAIAQGPVLPQVKKDDGIQPLTLVKLDKTKEAAKTYIMPPGSVKAFTSGPGMVWILSPGSDANERDLLSFQLTAGSTAVGIDPDSKEFGRFQVPEGQRAYVLACSPKPGKVGAKFTLSKWLISADKPDPEKIADAVIVVGEEKEDGKKDEGKKDEGKKTDPPGPKATKIYIAITYDTGNIDAELARLVGDTAFWNELTAGGSDWDGYSHKSADAISKGYIKALDDAGVNASKGEPGLLILDKETGKKLKTVKLPVSDREAIRKLVREAKN